MKQELNIHKIKQIAEKAKKDFWSNDGFPYENDKLLSFYNLNEATWISNASKLRSSDPIKTNLFLANIYRSNFTFKLIGDKLNIFDKRKRFSIQDKVDLIKNAFENAYFHFSFISICANLNDDFLNSLYINWHQPNKAKEFIKSKNENQWKVNNVAVSGKKWAIKNCPLFKFCPISTDYLSLIKNADSHQKLVITNKTIFILNEKNQSISIKDFNKLFQYVRNVVFLSFSFNLTLAIKHNFWTTPVLIISNAKKFNYSKVTLPNIQELEKKKNRKKKGKLLENFDSEKTEYFIAIIYTLTEFIFKDIWLKIENDKSNINDFLHQYDLKLDMQKLDFFRLESLKDTVELFISMNYKVRTWYLNDKIEKPSFDIKSSEFESFDFNNLIHEVLNTFKRIKELNEFNDKRDSLILFLISGAISMLAPLGRLNESMDKILIPK
jgi:hypothetical protein